MADETPPAEAPQPVPTAPLLDAVRVQLRQLVGSEARVVGSSYRKGRLLLRVRTPSVPTSLRFRVDYDDGVYTLVRIGSSDRKHRGLRPSERPNRRSPDVSAT